MSAPTPPSDLAIAREQSAATVEAIKAELDPAPPDMTVVNRLRVLTAFCEEYVGDVTTDSLTEIRMHGYCDDLSLHLDGGLSAILWALDALTDCTAWVTEGETGVAHLTVVGTYSGLPVHVVMIIRDQQAQRLLAVATVSGSVRRRTLMAEQLRELAAVTT